MNYVVVLPYQFTASKNCMLCNHFLHVHIFFYVVELGRFQNFTVPVLVLQTTFGFGSYRFSKNGNIRFRFHSVLLKIQLSVSVLEGSVLRFWRFSKSTQFFFFLNFLAKLFGLSVLLPFRNILQLKISGFFRL